jgi:hypothetical protein
MGYFQRYGSIKPGLGAQIDLSHPLGDHCLLVVPFNEGFGRPAIIYGAPSLGYPLQAFPSTAAAIFVKEPPSATLPTWIANLEGWGTTQASGVYWRFENNSTWVPQTACTMCIIRKRTNTTNSGGAWGCGGSSNTYAFNLLLPYSDGTVYWDFGGWAGANRLSVAGLSFSTTVPEKWIVTAGPRGSAIWQNGKKVASQSTGISRTLGGLTFDLATLTAQEINYFAIYDTQWSDDQCQWWSASPYEHLYSEIFGNKYFFLGDVIGGISGTITEAIPGPSFALVGNESIIGIMSEVIPLTGLEESGTFVDNPSNTRVQPVGNVSSGVRQFFRF